MVVSTLVIIDPSALNPVTNFYPHDSQDHSNMIVSGNFYLKQCDESIGCWCVDPETGARAKNTGVSNDQTPQCKRISLAHLITAVS